MGLYLVITHLRNWFLHILKLLSQDSDKDAQHQDESQLSLGVAAVFQVIWLNYILFNFLLAKNSPSRDSC